MLSEADGNQPGTLRIQGALDHCARGPGPVNLVPAGDDVKVTGSAGKVCPNGCEGRFVPLPVR
jgi:hypothetical protein